MLSAEFTNAAASVTSDRLQTIEAMPFLDVMKLPEVAIEDIVLAGKEVQLAVFRQAGIPNHPDAVLVTVQITRAGLGGMINYQSEQGLVFLPTGDTRRATEAELRATGR